MSLLQYLVKSGELLGKPKPDFDPLDEATINQNFDNYCLTCTITLKGVSKKESLTPTITPFVAGLKGNFIKQYEFLKLLVRQQICPFAEAYIFYPELHKCQEWIHIHGIIKFKKFVREAGLGYRRKLMKKIRIAIFSAIQGERRRYEPYKRRIDLSPIESALHHWNNYIRKDTFNITSLIKEAKPFYKMVINPTGYLKIKNDNGKLTLH